MFKAGEQGLIRHICTSFHDKPESIIKLVDTGYFESITLQYNMLDRKNEDGIAYAHENGMGVVTMDPRVLLHHLRHRCSFGLAARRFFFV